jgi:hypothetical protein
LAPSFQRHFNVISTSVTQLITQHPLNAIPSNNINWKVLGFNMSDQDQMDRVWPIITNKEAILVDHAWAGMPGTLFKILENGVEVWAKVCAQV